MASVTRTRPSMPSVKAQPLVAGASFRQRVLYLDNLKFALIAAIIAIHGILGYTDTGWWSYGDAREVSLSTVATTGLMLIVGPVGVVLIPLLFLVAGLMTPGSVERKGPGRFARDRLLRLGLPFIVYVLFIQPPVVYAVDHRWGNAHGSFWSEFLGNDGQPDTGPLWFVGVLLIYSLTYAGWMALRPARASRPPAITATHLGMAAAAVVMPTFLIRLAWPIGSESPADLNLWEWPACITVFILGVVAARQGWATAVPRRLLRQCRNATLAGGAAMLLVAGAAGLLGVDLDVMFGGWHWAAFGFTVSESVLVVFGAVWMLGLAQRFGGRYTRTAWWARNAYAAFIIQTPVLLGAAVVLRPLHAPAEVKAALVAGIGVAVAFALADLLRHIRPLARVL